MTDHKWTLLGARKVPPAPSWTFVVLAFLVGAETFLELEASYPLYMSIAVVGGGIWASVSALKAKSIFGLVVLPVSLIWLNPFFGGDWFESINPIMFLSHAAMALLFALVAYTYEARERKPK
jgi:hypothetical protein